MSNFELSVLFFLQLAIILLVCRLVGWLARWVGQPQVVAEMIAGVMLGPSLFGLFLPDVQAWLFPPASTGLIYAVSQVGLVLYMFLIGLEFDTTLIRNRLRSAAAVSLSGILAPFILGCTLGFFLVRTNHFFSPDVVTWEAMFFVGAAMAITAFPMLARIIYERGLSGTSLGTLALAAGSIDDAAAWCVLALVLASFSGDPMIAVLAIGRGTGDWRRDALCRWHVGRWQQTAPSARSDCRTGKSSQPGRPHDHLDLCHAGGLVHRPHWHLRRLWRFYHGGGHATRSLCPRGATADRAVDHHLFVAALLCLFGFKHAHYVGR